MNPKRRPKSTETSDYYHRYINQVRGKDFVATLKSEKANMLKLLHSLENVQWNYRYEAGKWTIKEVLIHLIDTERIFAYRALRIARNDRTAIPGFEQDEYIPNANAGSRSPDSVIKEYSTLRDATITFFEGLDETAYNRVGTASDNPLTPLAAGFIIAGHEMHHCKVLKERYL